MGDVRREIPGVSRHFETAPQGQVEAGLTEVGAPAGEPCRGGGDIRIVIGRFVIHSVVMAVMSIPSIRLVMGSAAALPVAGTFEVDVQAPVMLEAEHLGAAVHGRARSRQEDRREEQQ